MPTSLSLDQLSRDIAEGRIDTVVVAFTDMQGRLQAKFIHAPFFLSEVVGHGAEGCNYLLAVDIDMNTVAARGRSRYPRRAQAATAPVDWE